MEEPVYNKEYHIFREGKYLGIATWKQDSNVGDHFNKQYVDEREGVINLVHIADRWVPVNQQLN